MTIGTGLAGSRTGTTTGVLHLPRQSWMNLADPKSAMAVDADAILQKWQFLFVLLFGENALSKFLLGLLSGHYEVFDGFAFSVLHPTRRRIFQQGDEGGDGIIDSIDDFGFPWF